MGNLINLNGELLFAANDGTHGDELWQSDGTAAGTTMVADLNPGSNGSYPAFDGSMAILNGTLIYTADDGVHGAQPWAVNVPKPEVITSPTTMLYFPGSGACASRSRGDVDGARRQPIIGHDNYGHSVRGGR